MRKTPSHTIRAIGGYFELELAHASVRHTQAVALNSGRNALEYLLRLRNYRKVYFAVFTCAAVEETVRKLRMSFDKYSINERMEPIFDFTSLTDGDVFIYTNYFGLKSNFVRHLSTLRVNIIIDNAQAFFDYPIADMDTFYSPRKFFGVPDGGYAYTSATGSIELPTSYSSTRMGHLINRHDRSAAAAYPLYQEAEAAIASEPLCAMSALTTRILQSIDYKLARTRRKSNFSILHTALGDINKFHIDADTDIEYDAMTYPLMCDDSDLRERLHANSIFTATYWPNVISDADPESIEYNYATKLVHLPIDQRYGATEMRLITKLAIERWSA